MIKEYTDGKDLKVGDTIEVCWPPGSDTIVKFEPHPMAKKITGVNGRIATFRNKYTMTILDVDRLVVV